MLAPSRHLRVLGVVLLGSAGCFRSVGVPPELECTRDEQCASGLECSPEGRCQCTASSCAGCCSADGRACHSGQRDSACGTDGGLCTDCGADGMSCQSGRCQQLCGDECSSTQARQCVDSTQYEPCGDFDGDGCLEWGEPVACEAGTSCVEGACLAPCDECSPEDELRCSPSVPDAVEVCTDEDDDDCLEWVFSEQCDSSTSCVSGRCEPNCEGACAPDARRCTEANGGYRVCVDDGHGCPRWEIGRAHV
jgi:hypothetical protein